MFAAELVLMKETFSKAHTIFETLMDESLARHSASECQYGFTGMTVMKKKY